MTLDEARKVAAIIATADGGCDHCITPLARRLTDAFPGLVWVNDEKEPSWIDCECDNGHCEKCDGDSVPNPNKVTVTAAGRDTSEGNER